MEFPSILVETIAIFGTVQLVVNGLIIFLGRVWINRIHEIDKAKFAKELQDIKGNQERAIAVFQAAMQGVSAAHGVASERRAEAISALWKAVVALKRNASPAASLADIILEKEYACLLDKPQPRSSLSSLSMEDVHKKIEDTDSVEEHKPFLGLVLWSLSFVYRAFFLRVDLLFLHGRSGGEIKPWFHDSFIISMIKEALTENEFQQFLDRKIGKFSFVVDLLEQKMMLEAEAYISGAHSGTFSLEQALRMQRKAEDANR